MYKRIKLVISTRKTEIGLTILLIAIIAVIIVVATYDPDFHEIEGKIVFVSSPASLAIDNEIYMMEGDNLNIVNLTNTSGSNTTPAWSTDGQRIAFSSCRDGNWEIYLMKGKVPI